MKTLARTLNFIILFVAFSSACTKLDGYRRLASLNTVRDFTPPATFTLRLYNYCPTTKNFKDIFVSNFSVETFLGQAASDFDADGIPDYVERAHYTDYVLTANHMDSNGDGFSDLVTYIAGVTDEQQGGLYCLDIPTERGRYYGDLLSMPNLDTPDDNSKNLNFGLNKCEKKLILNKDPDKDPSVQFVFDTDGDGIPDYLELRCGLNPLDKDDAAKDMDGDGITNYELCKKHVPASESLSATFNDKLAYIYTDKIQTQSGSVCHEFEISNIAITNTSTPNIIAIYFIELDAANVPSLKIYGFYLQKDMAGKTVEIDVMKEVFKL